MYDRTSSAHAPDLGHPAGLVQIAGFLRRNALRFGDKTAYVCGDWRLNWRQADAISDRLAYRFRQLGLRRRQHVAILGDNSPMFVLATYALFKLGAAAVILNASLRGAHLAGQLNHADASAVVSGTGLQPAIDAVRGDLLASPMLLTWDAADRTPDVINIATAVGEGDAETPFPIEGVDPGDVACLIFSSGTTGTPKGAINTYWNLLAKQTSLGFSQELCQTDVGLVATPVCMGGTQLMSINPYVMLGIPAVVMPSFDAGEALRLIEVERVTTGFLVPTMINAMLKHGDYERRDISSLKRLISAGSPLPQEVYERIAGRGIGVLECYGTSETGGGVMISAEEKRANPRSVGRPMVGFEVRIVDAAGKPTADGEVGEFAIRGDPVARGYYKQPEIEAETYVDGWFHTGDLGRRDAEGYLYLVDRKKDMVKTGGVNVFPKDIEEVIYRLPGVAECAVVGLPHEHWGEAVTAFIVRKPDTELTDSDVLGELKHSLANYQIPKAVVFVEELPKTLFGKLSKLKLREEHARFYVEQGLRAR